MPLRNYGVLKGRIIKRKRIKKRYEMLVATQKRKFRASVNLKSDGFPSELLYYTIKDFKHPITDQLKELHLGYNRLDRVPENASLDYIRDNIFEPARMMIPSFDDYMGNLNDLHHELDSFVGPMLPPEEVEYILRTDIDQPLVYIFGERWGPEPHKNDPFFDFHPGNGMHNVHMNQGNVKKWTGDDGIWQDGGIIFYYPDTGRWSALFLAFQTQAFHTDDATGYRLLPEPTPEHPEPLATEQIPARTDPISVKIVASLINPMGNDIGKETVHLLNTSDQSIDLKGWRLIDKQHRYHSLNGVTIEPQEEKIVRLDGTTIVLSNQGGTITLLNPNDIKIHGVAYLRKHAYKEGVLVRFDTLH